MNTMYPTIQTNMPYYGMGQIDTSSFCARPFSRNAALPDCSANIVQRNRMTINSVKFEKEVVKPNSNVNQMKNKNLNNYLKPTVPFNSSEK